MPPQGCGGCWPDQHLTTAIKDLSHWPRLFSSRYHMGASLISFLTGTALMKLTDALVSVLMLYKNIQVYLKKKNFFKRLWEKRAKLPSAQTVPILKTQTIQHTGISQAAIHTVQITSWSTLYVVHSGNQWVSTSHSAVYCIATLWSALPSSPFLTGRMFVREPSWKYSSKVVGS